MRKRSMKTSYGLLYITTSECETVEEVNKSRILVVRSPSYLYQKLMDGKKKLNGPFSYFDRRHKKFSSSLANLKYLEYLNLYEAMFGYSKVECEYVPPRGRMEDIDYGNSDVTKVREFIEETNGLYHPDFREAFSLPVANESRPSLPQLTDSWMGLDGNFYKAKYSIYIDDKNQLQKCPEGEPLLNFILTYLYGSANDTSKVFERYRYTFQYNEMHDIAKHVCYFDLSDFVNCHWMSNRLETLTHPDFNYLKGLIKDFIQEKKHETHCSGYEES